MLEFKGYITNLGKYNEGELMGEWVDFPISEDELNELYKRIGMNYIDEDGHEVITGYEEIFFTDWETDFKNNFGEYENIEALNELAEKMEDWDEDLFNACSELWSIDEILNNGADDYYLYSDITTDYDLGYYWIEESGCYDLSNLGALSNYINYEAFGRDVRLESNGGFTSYGWVEYAG